MIRQPPRSTLSPTRRSSDLIAEVRAGDIAAAIGLKDTKTGDTLCDEGHPIILEAMKFPQPVISVAIEPKTKARSEEHTSELQSRLHLVCRLLLCKKNELVMY